MKEGLMIFNEQLFSQNNFRALFHKSISAEMNKYQIYKF